MIGIGVNIRPFLNKVARAAADYYNRITADGGVSESPDCVNSGMSDLDRQNLLNNASLLLIPSGYKGGKLYSEIPTNGNGDLTWTRGSDAFRTNASGLIQRVPWNLFQYSEAFDNSAWLKSQVSVSANATTAPNGTLTADKLTEDSSNAVHNILPFVGITTTATSYTYSVYAKADTRNWILLYNTTAVYAKTFNLSTGVVGTASVGTSTATITNVGDGWFRCSITGTCTAGANDFRLYLLTSDTVTASYQGNGTSGIYIWGAQLVEGTTAQTYLPTTDRLNFPRLSYMYGSCPSALLEPQRTNLALQSQDFDNAYWVKLGGSITANSTTSPDGTTNADTITENTATSDHKVYKVFSVTASTTYTLSSYVKKNGRSIVYLFDAYTSRGAYFNLDTLAISNIGLGLTNSAITSLNNGWYRISGSVTPSGVSMSFEIGVTNSTSSMSYTGDGTSGIFIYGAQLEAGAYPTTYIPTTSATATRVADSFSRNNIYTNGLISASGGTWFVELKNNIAYPRVSGYPTLFISSNTAGASTLTFGFASSISASRFFLYSWISGTFTNIGTTSTDNVKVAFAFTTTTLKVFVNGSVFASYTGLTIDPTTIQYLMGIAEVPLFVQQMALFSTPLSDTDCELLTGTAYSSYESMATALGYYVI